MAYILIALFFKAAKLIFNNFFLHFFRDDLFLSFFLIVVMERKYARNKSSSEHLCIDLKTKLTHQKYYFLSSIGEWWFAILIKNINLKFCQKSN